MKGKEEVFEMRDGCGQHMLILFRPSECIISGMNAELYDWERDLPKMEALTQGLPNVFYEFMYEEPVKSLKSTFCIWTTNGKTWSTGNTRGAEQEDGSREMLGLLDGSPKKYVDFCKWYYETEIPLNLTEKIYRGETLTLEMIQRLNSRRDDVDTIKAELCEIDYPNIL